MKKISLVAITALLTSAAFSQVKWGIQATGNLSTAGLSAELAEGVKKNAIIGFGAGVVAETSFGKQLSVRTSLNLLQKGVKLKAGYDLGEGDEPLSIESTVSNKLFYAELPVNLIYSVAAGKGNVFFGAGPSIGYGLFGKSKVDMANPFDPTEKETEEYDAFKKEKDGGAGLKRIDISANAVVGYQWNNGLTVNVGYLHGFTNLIENSEESTYKNRGLQLTIGYSFGKK